MIKELIIIFLMCGVAVLGYSYYTVHKSLDMVIDWDNLSIDEYPKGIMREGSHYCVVFDGDDEYTENHEICHEMVYRDTEHFCKGEIDDERT